MGEANSKQEHGTEGKGELSLPRAMVQIQTVLVFGSETASPLPSMLEPILLPNSVSASPEVILNLFQLCLISDGSPDFGALALP